VRIWRVIGDYNRFFADNEQYYTDARSLASLALVLDNRSQSVPLLNGLSGRRVMFNVLYEHELTPARLKPYVAVGLFTAITVRDRALKTLEDYVNNGGKLFAAGRVAMRDESARPRSQPAFFKRATGKGNVVYFDKLPEIDNLARMLIAEDREPIVTLQAPDNVLYNVTEQAKTGRVIVHLLNYSRRPVDQIRLSVRGEYANARLLSPDNVRPAVCPVVSAQSVELTCPLKIYSILVLEKKNTNR
jgi:hypothetical protein